MPDCLTLRFTPEVAIVICHPVSGVPLALNVQRRERSI
jgi:hypothetical protein